MSKVKLVETENQRRLHIGNFFTDLNESDYQELVKIFAQKAMPSKTDFKRWFGLMNANKPKLPNEIWQYFNERVSGQNEY